MAKEKTYGLPTVSCRFLRRRGLLKWCANPDLSEYTAGEIETALKARQKAKVLRRLKKQRRQKWS